MPGYSKEPSFRVTGTRSAVTEVALALVAKHKDGWFASGTATVIGPHLAITARHVIEDYWKRFERVPLEKIDKAGESTDVRGSFAIVAFQFLDEGTRGALWTVTKLWTSPFSDVAFLRLSPWSKETAGYSWFKLSMNLIPPGVGAQIVGFGYHRSAIETEERGDTVEVVNWSDLPATSVGEVIEVHEKKRDNVLLRFPCFRTNARFDGGMSGGPVFDDAGYLRGIISLGSELCEGDNNHVSYVASLWPCMGTKIDMDREGFPARVSYRVLELAKHGLIHAKNWERVVIVEDPSGGNPSVGLLLNCD